MTNRTVFADAGYWIALLNRRDDLADRARHVSQLLSNVKIVTSEMVLVEVLNDFSKRGELFRATASTWVDSLHQHPMLTIVHQTSNQFRDGLELYKQRLDKAWSLTDCVSFQIMRDRSITEALAYDKHFEQAGFVALLRYDSPRN